MLAAANIEFHEQGHGYFFPKFGGETESNVNLLQAGHATGSSAKAWMRRSARRSATATPIITARHHRHRLDVLLQLLAATK